MAFSIKDLARIAGVSVSTVTRALQDRPDISVATKARIIELAQKHNYRPNILARSLVTSRTYTVGIIVPDLTNPFFPALIKGIESTLWADGYNVVLADTNYDTEKERQSVDEFISRRVDGLIMSPIETHQYHSWMDQIRSAGIPFVSLTRLANHDADTVIASDRFGARAAAEHLIAIGRSRIAYIGNQESEWANSERIGGIREAYVAAGIPFPESLIHNARSGSMDASRSEVEGLIDEGTSFDAVIAFDDLMALGVRAALAGAGKRVPQDVALVGFDNIDISALPEIDLTTVDIPKIELGKVSAQLMVERIEERAASDRKANGAKPTSTPYKEIVLNTQLVIRGTTG